MYYQRILASQDKIAVANEIQTTEPKPEYEKIVKDPYVMEFLQIQPDTHVYEGDLEQALIDHLQHFLLELGRGFSFVARQKRFTLDGQDFFIDLVFYNYILKCFVLIDLKKGKLQNGYGKSSIEKYFKDCDDIDFLDAIDYFFYLIDKKIRTIKPEYQYDYDVDGAINAAIAELNYRFKQHNLGYEFANSQIITIPDEYTDYALHLAATNFLFLVRLYRNKKQNYD